MLRVNNLVGFGVGGGFRFQLNGTYGDRPFTEVSSATYPSVPFGPYDPNRLVVVGAAIGRGTNNNSAISCTIGGVSATKHVNINSAASHSWNNAAIYSAQPSGESGDIAFSMSTAFEIGAVEISVFSLYGLNSLTPYVASVQQENYASPLNINPTFGGQFTLYVVSADDKDAGPFFEWSSATEIQEFNSPDIASMAYKLFAGNETLTVAAAAVGEDFALVAASWG